MPQNSQTYATHVRRHPIYHFFLLPAVTVNLAIAIWRFAIAMSWESGQHLLVAVILVVAAVLIRVNPLRAQDRSIRLEEKLRYERVLPKELALRAGGLRVAQIVALRFASDEELPGLIEQILAGRLTKSKEIKQAIKNWRGDYDRV
jgi:hypothetical protein